MRMIAIRHTMFGVTCLLFCSPVAASSWQYLTKSDDGMIVSVDVTSLRELPGVPINRPASVRQIWVRLDLSQVKNDPAREAKQLMRYDCASETSLTVSYTEYTPRGTVLKSWSRQDYDFNYKPVIPDSIGYAMMEFACGRMQLP